MNSDYSIELAHTVGVPTLNLSAHKVTEVISAPQLRKELRNSKKQSRLSTIWCLRVLINLLTVG